MADTKSLEINGRTAIIVIHGIGEQNPFETLDQFGRSLYETLSYNTTAHDALNPEGRRRPLDYRNWFQQNLSDKYSINHTLLNFQNNKGDTWIDSLISIKPKENNTTNFVDVHEYYWANLTEEKISTGEIGDWLVDTINGGESLYEKSTSNQGEVDQKKLKDALTNKEHKFDKLRRLLRRVLVWYRVLKILILIINGLKSVLQLIPVAVITKFFNGIKENLMSKASVYIRGYVGDIAIYTTMDVKKKHYELREKILEGARLLFEKVMSDPQYDKIVIAGHSLGSVVAYDTLNKITIKASLTNNQQLLEQCKKVKGLITFGSPLDKVLFFFQQHTEMNEYIRRQILSHLHSFKIARSLIPNVTPVVSNPVHNGLNHISWYNYYDHNDPVSNSLDFYDVTENIDCRFPITGNRINRITHTNYWTFTTMYQELYKQYLK